MLDLNSAEWATFEGGYKVPFNASVLLLELHRLDQPSETVWDGIWNNLYHQGDVGVASYASLPWLLSIYKDKGWIDYHLPNFVYAVERARQSGSNPMVPSWLRAEYEQAVENTASYCLEKRKTLPERNFHKAVILLIAIMMTEPQIAELVDYVALGDEEKAMEAYYASAERQLK